MDKMFALKIVIASAITSLGAAGPLISTAIPVTPENVAIAGSLIAYAGTLIWFLSTVRTELRAIKDALTRGTAKFDETTRSLMELRDRVALLDARISTQESVCRLRHEVDIAK